VRTDQVDTMAVAPSETLILLLGIKQLTGPGALKTRACWDCWDEANTKHPLADMTPSCEGKERSAERS
jgi:hypothetical protein